MGHTKFDLYGECLRNGCHMRNGFPFLKPILQKNLYRVNFTSTNVNRFRRVNGADLESILAMNLTFTMR
jgi:hypothetical protein